MHRWSARVLMVVLVVSLAGCGVPLESSSRGVGDRGFVDERGPTAVLPEMTPAPTTRAADSTFVYFVGEGALRPVARNLSASPTAGEVIAALQEGPADDESALGLRSVLASGRPVRSVSVSGGVASVDLSDAFAALAAREQLLALGQIVLSMTSLRGVGLVDVTLAGRDIAVPISDNSTVNRMVSRDDYVALTRARPTS